MVKDHEKTTLLNTQYIEGAGHDGTADTHPPPPPTGSGYQTLDGSAGGHHGGNGVGKDLLRRQASVMDPKDSISLTWDNVNVYAPIPQKRRLFGRNEPPPPPKHILKSVCGAVEPGTLQVIMGASGSGKTTLLNCLTRRNLAALDVTGEVRVNGQMLDEDINSITGYVQQEDLFVGTLTVSEHLWFQAKLRMGRELSDEERQNRIDEIMLEMGLTKCKNTFIGVPGMLKGLSGGEKKRLSFATELLRNPPLLFCDEPTSGLDSFMAQSVMEILVKLANRGRTILCTVHQPSSNVFKTFQQLLLMAEGRVAYMGETRLLNDFFRGFEMVCPPNFNPADFYIQSLAIMPGKEAECRRKVNAICDGFAESSGARKIRWMLDNNNDGPHMPNVDKFVLEMEEMEENLKGPKPAKLIKPMDPRQASKQKYNASWIIQFQLLYWRCFMDAKRNKRVLPTRFLQIMTAGVLVGLIYWQTPYDQLGVSNINSALFLLMIQISFNTSFTIATAFAREFPVFLKENKDRTYKASPYYVAKVLIDFPVFIVAATLYCIAAYFMIGLNPNADSFLRCWMALVLIALVAVSYGHMASAVFPNPQLALTLLPFLLGVSLIFSGFLVKEDSVSVVFLPLQALSYYRYSYEILLVNQWHNVGKLDCEHTDTANQYRQQWNVTVPQFSNDTVHPQATPESSNWCYPVGQAIIYSYGYEPDVAHLTGLYFILLAFMFSAEIIGFLALYSKTRKK